MPKLEIAVTSLEEALRAEEGGADSVEVSVNLAVGGTTPPIEMVEAVVRAVRIDVHVLVRPHAESFHYSAADIDRIIEDCSRLSKLKIKSIVFGAWDRQHRLDLALIAKVQAAALPAPVTVHRALDRSLNPEDALDALTKLGIKRVLTAGAAATAWDSRQQLAQWVAAFGSQINFVAAGSLRLLEIPELISQVNAHAYHFGSAARSNGRVDAAKVRELRAALHTDSAGLTERASFPGEKRQ
ncbi:MAG TPA: copper homeostasis protein CutC [Planctomycetota bacterium]|jgi:copper homeostasis protein